MAIMNNGQIVFQGAPQDALVELKGKVWRKSIERNEREQYKSNFQVISDKMVAGKPQIHILSEHNPGNGFRQIEPNLEDVFFTKTHSVTV